MRDSNHDASESAAEGPARSSRRAALHRIGVGVGAGAALAAAPFRAGAEWPPATPEPASPPIAPPAAPDSFVFRFGASAPVRFPSGAAVRFARAAEFPALSGLSLAAFDVAPDAARELHWHDNVAEVGWCLGGAGRMVVLDEDGRAVSFALEPDTLYVAPKGLAHAFWAVGDAPMRIVLAFDDARPETIEFSQMMPFLPAAVVAASAGGDPGAVPLFPSVPEAFAGPVAGGTAVLEPAEGAADDPSADRFRVRLGVLPTSDYAGGTLAVAGAADLPALVGLTSAVMTLSPGATREAHWHPAMGELALVLDGAVQVGLVGPKAFVQTALLHPGDLVFVPENWLHYLANLGDGPARVLLFHDGLGNRSVELSQVLNGFPPAVLAASYGMDPSALAALAGGGVPVIAGTNGTE